MKNIIYTSTLFLIASLLTLTPQHSLAQDGLGNSKELKQSIVKLQKLKEIMGDSLFGNHNDFLKQMIKVYNEDCSTICTKHCVTMYKFLSEQDGLNKKCKSVTP